jgi:hypothetical protein
VLNRLGKNVPRFVEIIARIKQAIDLHAVARPFLDFVEVARIGDGSLVSSSDQSPVISEAHSLR